MTAKKKSRFSVITNTELQDKNKLEKFNDDIYQSNPIYEKLLKFRNLQEQQKKKFSVEDLFKLC